MDAKTCVGCLKEEDCGGTSTPACDMDAKTCVGCLGTGDCRGSTPVCDKPAKTCVGCLEKKDCGGGTKPICEAKSCRGCKTDSECADPGICMEDGHCATSNEVVYVDEERLLGGDAGRIEREALLRAERGGRGSDGSVAVIVIRGTGQQSAGAES